MQIAGCQQKTVYVPYQYVYKIGYKCAIWIFTKQKQAVLGTETQAIKKKRRQVAAQKSVYCSPSSLPFVCPSHNCAILGWILKKVQFGEA